MPAFHHVVPGQSHLGDELWRIVMLVAFGARVERNVARFPETMRALANVDGVQTAFFSILEAGKHIPGHFGPNKGVLRYHLGLEVPEPVSQCFIVLNGQRYNWAVGEGVLFDDTFFHYVRNDTKGRRIVLFLDIERPGLRGIPWALQMCCRYMTRYHPRVRQVVRDAELQRSNSSSAASSDAQCSAQRSEAVSGRPVVTPHAQLAERAARDITSRMEMEMGS